MKKIFSKVAILTLGVALAAGAGVALSAHKEAMGVSADDPLVYTLDGTITGGTNGYATTSDITQSDILWKIVGNTDISPWRIGGKNLNDVDRTLYSTQPIEANVSKIEIEHGTKTITVNSMKVEVASDAEFGTIVSSFTPTYAASSTVTIERESGKDWTNAYYRITYNVDAGGSNQYLQFKSAKFYGEGGTPVVIKTTTVTTITAPKTTLDLAVEGDKVQLSAAVTAEEAVVAGATVSWESDTPTVATVSDTGLVTPVTTGKAKITASYAGSDTYKESSDSVEITVTESIVAAYYSLVESADELYEGGKYIITSAADDGALKVMATQNNNNRAAFGVNLDGTLVPVADSSIAVITLGRDSGKYTLGVTGGYLYAASSSSNHLKTQATVDANARWDITFGTGSAASIVATDSTNRKVMQYNSGSSLFSCYAAASQADVYIYRLNFEETLLKAVVCDGNGSHQFATGYTWADLKGVYNNLSTTEKTAMLTASNAGLERYDYLIAKYGTAVYENFIGRTITPLAQSLVGEGEGASFNTTALIAVVAAIALTSVAGIVTVIIVRRRRFHN